jgi:hypothetical protein
MSLGRGIFFGVMLAAVALGAWLTLSWFTGMTLLILAIVVGGCAGAGVGIGNGGRGGAAAGIAAGTIAVCLGLVGRFYAVQFAFMAEARQEAAMVGEPEAIQSIAQQIAEKRGNRTDNEDYDVTGAAELRWSRLSEDQKATYLAALRQDREVEAGRMDFGAGLLLSVLTLRFMDFVCIGLTASAAFSTASRRIRTGTEPTATPDGQPVVVGVSEERRAGAFATLGRIQDQEAAKDSKAA